MQESDDLASVAISAIDGASALAHYWSRNRPKMVLIIADRSETLGVAMCASLMQIPIVHLQGGERSGSIDDKVRSANSKLADYHLTTNQTTFNNLIALGESPHRIEIVGCPSIDLVSRALKDYGHSKQWPNVASSYGGVGHDFKLNSSFGIIMFHPDTMNSNENIEWLDFILKNCHDVSDLVPNWLWFWPNPDYGSHEIASYIRRKRERGEFQGVRFIINLPPESFVELAISSRALIGNSSFGIREASFLGLPTLNLGLRQNLRERGFNVIDIPYLNSKPKTPDEFRDLLGRHRAQKSVIYGNGSAGEVSSKILSKWIIDPSIK